MPHIYVNRIMSHEQSSRGERHNNRQELSAILVAESDRATANLIRTALESVGEQVVLATNLAETISHCQNQPVNVAVVDDYISKPFSTSDLLMRIQRVRQRNESSHSAARRRAIVGDLQLDHAERQVMIRGRQVDLTPTEYRLLKMLMQSPDKAVHKAELVEAIWKNRFYTDENVLRVTMRRLRSKIELDPSRPAYLVTVYGTGYKLAQRDHS